jgi:hypothetical protein
MNRIAHFVFHLFGSDRNTSVRTAQDLLERSAQARGLSRYDAALLRANAHAVLSVLR